jgi:2-oxoglutarate dehydrogenase E1 component
VNGDEPESVAHVAALAWEYRDRYKMDIVIDLVGYRRWGHNEGDEPSYTQPLMYAKIKSHTSAGQLYSEHVVRSGAMTREEVDGIWAEKKAEMQREGDGGGLGPIARRAPTPAAPVDAAAMWGRLRTTLTALSTVPSDFELHPKLMPLLKRRAELLAGRGEVDWSTAESLAFGTLLLEGVPVRLSGQDTARGTFSQRHAVFFDVRTGREHIPLNSIAPSGTRFEVHDSLLSEAAVMGFEFGYAVAEHRALVMWEAQFGDFWNGAQVIVDQFLVASETKWSQPQGLVLLLPHGHEGQGPEHSSARIERFLTLCAEDNMRVCYPSSPASYFHLLRRQGRDPVEKPLVVMTPKSLLRHPRCQSPLATFAEGRFEEVLDDAGIEPGRVRRIVLTTGKLYYDLLKAREDKHVDGVALVRLEQLYPFPAHEVRDVLDLYPNAEDVCWVQEEPQNMGAWDFVYRRVRDLLPAGREPRYVGREDAASPATGSYKIHQSEQVELVTRALSR